MSGGGNGKLDSGEDAIDDGSLTRQIVRTAPGVSPQQLGSANNISDVRFELIDNPSPTDSRFTSLRIRLQASVAYGPNKSKLVRNSLESRIRFQNAGAGVLTQEGGPMTSKRMNQEGMALIFAMLAIIIIFSSLALMSTRLVAEKRNTDHAYDNIVLEEAARAGIDVAIQQLWNRYITTNGNTTGNWASYKYFIANELKIPNTEDLNGNGRQDEGEGNPNGVDGFEAWPTSYGKYGYPFIDEAIEITDPETNRVIADRGRRSYRAQRHPAGHEPHDTGHGERKRQAARRWCSASVLAGRFSRAPSLPFSRTTSVASCATRKFVRCPWSATMTRVCTTPLTG